MDSRIELVDRLVDGAMKKVVMYVNIISPHQLPLAREIVRLIGAENFKYVYAEDFHADRKAMGWNDEDVPQWCVKGDEDMPELIEADLVYTGIRCPSLMARRSAAGKKTVYYSERWFKPIPFGGMLLPGWLRMLAPRYRKMARRMVGLLNEPTMKYFSCGPWAVKDLMRIGLRQSQIIPWGYFVKSSELKVKSLELKEESTDLTHNSQLTTHNSLRVLWVGRLLGLKRVDTIIRAVGELSTRSTCSTRPLITLDVYGSGPEEMRLKKMASRYGDVIRFHPSVPIAEVRRLMREHDVYVFSSNGMDGWGAVVNEALEEGMYVIGTRETGASASMLPEESLFSCGDWKRLASLLTHCIEAKRCGTLKGQGIGEWTARSAARRLLDLAV